MRGKKKPRVFRVMFCGFEVGHILAMIPRPCVRREVCVDARASISWRTLLLSLADMNCWHCDQGRVGENGFSGVVGMHSLIVDRREEVWAARSSDATERCSSNLLRVD